MKNILSYGPEGQKLELHPLNVVIGPNGSGKSNLLDVIGLLQAAPVDLQQAIRVGGGIGNWLWKSGTSHTIAEVEALLGYSRHEKLRYKLNFHEVDQRFQINGETLEDSSNDGNLRPIQYFDASPDFVYVLRERAKGIGGMNTAKVETAQLDQSVLSYMRGPAYPELTQVGTEFERIQFFREWAFGHHAPLRYPQSNDLPNDKLTRDFSNVGLVLNRIKRQHPSIGDRILHELRKLYDGITDIDVSIEGGTVQLFLREGDITVPATRLSDGTLRYLCLLVALCQPNPTPLICIQEPELGLHPDLLPSLGELMREASKCTQLIVTTHSDVLVDTLTDRPECVVICEKKEGKSRLKRLESAELKEWLEDYSLGELWARGDLGGNRW